MQAQKTPSSDLNVYQDLKETKKVEKKTFVTQALFNLKSYKILLKSNQKLQKSVDLFLRVIYLIDFVLFVLCVLDFD